MIRFTPSSIGKPEPGKILLAEPFMADPHFGRKAILLCEHNEEGSFGFVLNNFIEVGLNELLDDLPSVNCRLSLGGPVKNSNLYYLHTIQGAPDAIAVRPGLFMGGDFGWVRSLLDAGEQLEADFVSSLVMRGGHPANLRTKLKSVLVSSPVQILTPSWPQTAKTRPYGNPWSRKWAPGSTTSQMRPQTHP